MAQNDVDQQETSFEDNGFAHPVTGTILTVASGLSFLFLTMILSIVGPAAMSGSGSPGAYRAPWANNNILSFLGVLALSLTLGVLAVLSKLERRKIDGSPLPYFSFGLCAICVFLLVAFLTGILYV